MDIVKFKITPKTIKVEVRNDNNYIFDFNNSVSIAKENKDDFLNYTMLLTCYSRKKHLLK